MLQFLLLSLKVSVAECQELPTLAMYILTVRLTCRAAAEKASQLTTTCKIPCSKVGFLWQRAFIGGKMKTRGNSTTVYLHDELAASGHPPFGEQHILWLLLLLGLLNLSQATDRVHALAIVRSRLGKTTEVIQVAIPFL